MSDLPFDVLVLGGGPSGCAAAIVAARAGLSVVLLERSNYQAARIGETLAPESAPWLAKLGLLSAIQSVPRVVSSGIESLWGDEPTITTDFLFNPFGPGLHLDRARFDAALACHAEQCGATVYRNSRPCGFRKQSTGWQLWADVDRVPRSFACRWIVDATGRSAWFIRRHSSATRKTDRLLAMQAQFSPAEDADHRLGVEALPDGWAYCAPLPNGTVTACVLTDAGTWDKSTQTPALFAHLLTQSRLISRRVGSSQVTSLHVTDAATQYCRQTIGPGWIAVGDAAITPDPLSGSGIHSALASGLEGGQTILSIETGDQDAMARYQLAYESMLHRRLTEQSEQYARVTVWRDRPFWKRRT